MRNINNTLNHLEHDRYIYYQKLSAILGPDPTEECKGFIEDLKETRHLKVMKHQKEKNLKGYGTEKNMAAIVAKW